VTGEAVRLADISGNDKLLARAEQERGRALGLVSREEEARQASAHAVRLAEEVNDLATLQTSLNNLAYLQRRAGNLRGAEESYRRSLDVAERVGDPSVTAFARFVLGRVYVEQGRWTEARAEFENALRASQSAGSSWYSSYAMAGLGYVDLLEGNRDEGLRYLHEAVSIAERNEDLQGLMIHRYIARQEILDGRPGDAVARLERVRELTARAGRELYQNELTWALIEAGNEERAAEFLQHVDERILFEGRVEMTWVFWTKAMLAARQGRLDDAMQCLEEGLTLAREIGIPFDEGLLLVEYGRILARKGTDEAAHQRLEAALAIFQRLGARPYSDLIQGEMQLLRV
ncbi:MAG TPA: tetratricopeptide repeat protein, partial [Chloroflexota bacterium]